MSIYLCHFRLLQLCMKWNHLITSCQKLKVNVCSHVTDYVLKCCSYLYCEFPVRGKNLYWATASTNCSCPWPPNPEIQLRSVADMGTIMRRVCSCISYSHTERPASYFVLHREGVLHQRFHWTIMVPKRRVLNDNIFIWWWPHPTVHTCKGSTRSTPFLQLVWFAWCSPAILPLSAHQCRCVPWPPLLPVLLRVPREC